MTEREQDWIGELVKKASAERDRVKQILSYFVRNPQAADSLEGIARWRLLDQAIHQAVNETRDALGWLVERGYLRQEAGGTAPVFSLNAERRGECERFLAALPAPRKRRQAR
jgi:hypothetical protein